MASISTPDLEGILEQKGILGMAQRLNLNYSLDTWVYHDRKEHKVFVDAGIRLFSPVCGCVGMVHMTNLGPGSGLLLSRIDIGLPGILPPKTGIFAHQMEPVDTPDHFEGIAKLTRDFPRIRQVDLLPYHALGNNKRAQLNRPADGFRVPEPAETESWHRTLSSLCAVPVKR